MSDTDKSPEGRAPEERAPEESGRFSALAVDECLELLRTHQIGRIGWQGSEGPTILPVTYLVHAGRVLFRTSADGVLAELERGGEVAFEVDDFDLDTQTGWSVVVRGGAAAPVDLRDVPGGLPEPWAGGARDQVICLSIERITGRIVSRGD
ncbi:hypothetical protein CGZ93_08890 [Enemella dayhoffiae]|uniref:Pyridoxamine 5'-phosphate oxidase family protein n=1 Tax=Enemella dayhoffiae TaxID=2016507 RepID=A0A255H344_9ACTN|nr:pyridoxamine 5'-phosphate oxidase family protein [Enemella dayhoffiae]OYO22029.1 hypothetical protein CGZ93_08890 [Enemella dayhoffiae]